MNNQRIVAALTITLCVFLLGGCAWESAKEAEALRQAMAKVPLPPGSYEMRIDGDLPTSFYVAAPYIGATEEGLLQFYRSWFDEKGWAPKFPEGDGLPEILSFVKGGALMTVTVLHADPALQLVVTYAESGAEVAEVPESLHFAPTPVGIDTKPSTSTP